MEKTDFQSRHKGPGHRTDKLFYLTLPLFNSIANRKYIYVIVKTPVLTFFDSKPFYYSLLLVTKSVMLHICGVPRIFYTLILKKN